MGLLGPMLWQLLLLGVILPATAASPAKVQQTNPNCPKRCGNLTIPYPFGTREGCYLDDTFLITCNHSKPFLRKGYLDVLNISLEGQLRVSSLASYDCYENGKPSLFFGNSLALIAFPISNTQNKFTAVGCDTKAIIQGSSSEKEYFTGCMSLCNAIEDVINGSCSGIGCCQTSIPKDVRYYSIIVSEYNNHSNVQKFNPCSYAFVVEEGGYNFSTLDLADLRGQKKFPLVLDWAIGDKTCKDAKMNKTAYACQENSVCYESDNGPGYRCNCPGGYKGNPYLTNGCQDINECEDNSLNQCTSRKFCRNTVGNYSCFCPKGYHGDGKKDGRGCIADQSLWTKIAVGISIGVLALLLGTSWLYLGLKQRKLIKLKEIFFEQNGGNLLRQRTEGSGKTIKIFSEKELIKSTNNYHESRILGKGGQGIVYKGILPGNRIVAIKKSRIGDQSQVEPFINEVIVLSQINHRNVVKILGCCLETEVPLLVYEFVTNGTLFDHIHNGKSFITWEVRLKIAAEAAGVLSYLHSAASTPIIHRDIKLANILLDDNFNAKVSDFGASRLIPLDQTQLTTLVQGTRGYLDPEYLLTSQLTEKSDVYSFGVVLMELLTGKEAVSFRRSEKERNLAMYFVSAVKEDRLLQVLDDRVMNERNVEQLKEVATLAMRCVKVKGEERPTMKEVALELEGLRAMERNARVEGELYAEEDEYLLGEPSNTYGGGSTSNIAEYDSSKNQVAFELEDGR